jgi:hypothetical protein
MSKTLTSYTTAEIVKDKLDNGQMCPYLTECIEVIDAAFFDANCLQDKAFICQTRATQDKAQRQLMTPNEFLAQAQQLASSVMVVKEKIE